MPQFNASRGDIELSWRTRTRVDSEPLVNITCPFMQVYVGSCDRPFAYYRSTGYDLHGSYTPYSKTETMHDVVTPNFGYLRNKGTIVNNPYDKTDVTTIQEPIDYFEASVDSSTTTCNGVPTRVARTGGYWDGQISPGSYLVGPYPPTPSVDRERVQNIAITGAWAKVNAEEFASLPALAESEESIRSLISITKRLYRITKALRRFDVKRLYKELSLKQLADRWMEARYSLRPLAYDMSNCSKALAFKKPKHPFRQTYRSGYTETEEASWEVLASQRVGYWKLYANATTTRTITAKAGVLAAIEEITNSMVWGLTRPVEALWELVPFSFVADWFLNIGKTIASWTPKVGFQVLASWVVVTDTTSQTRRITRWEDVYNAPSTQWWRQLSFHGGMNDIHTVLKYRTVNPSRPVLPSLNVRLDAAKLLDLVIMTKQQLSHYRG